MMHHDDSEQALLGAVLSVENPQAFAEVGALVRPDDWWRPSHATLWAVLVTMHTAGMPTDPVLVGQELERAKVSRQVGGAEYLHTLYASACAAHAVEWHARRVADAATIRRVAAAGTRIAQHAESPDVEPAALVQWAAEQVAAARDERAGVDVLTVGWDAFLHRSTVAPPAVIPGMLGQGDRLVLTGSGGLGKSTLLQMIAVCAAAGLPPLDWGSADPYDPVPTMIFDCENPDHKRKTRLWPMVQACVNLGLDPRPNLTLGGSGASFDLLNPRNALSLLRTVEHDKPQLLYIGPVYKLHNDDPDKESVVKKITAVLDGIREMGVALITEAHPNKGAKAGGPMSPSGSALWEWWPEFGVGLRLDPDSDEVVRRCKLERWRIDRDESRWPLYVQASGDPGLPWERAALFTEDPALTGFGASHDRF